MDEKKYKILLVGDIINPTGFSRVMHSILEYLPDMYEIHILGVNYYGDPHDYPYKIYPAQLGGDAYGINRIEGFAEGDLDLIFILNDSWIINNYLAKIKETFKKIPYIVTYCPIDSTHQSVEFFSNYDIVTQPVVYTEFAKQEVMKAAPALFPKVIPHGVDTKYFHKIFKPKKEIKAILFPKRDDYINSFIVLNGNRNQPRKRLDISLEAFKLFSEDKPINVKYYHHAGMKDAGWEVARIARYMGIDNRLILTGPKLEMGNQKVPIEKLNIIYNATDVGVNCSMGEGWGLVSMEHAATGAPQVLGDHSAHTELWKDCGYLVPAEINHIFESTSTVAKVVRAEDVAKALEDLYRNQELYDSLSKRALDKFTSKEYSWEKISLDWHNLFLNILE